MKARVPINNKTKNKIKQFLEDAGIDLKSFFDNGEEHENET